jgi:nucleoside-diphosphate-sugar epimerase
MRRVLLTGPSGFIGRHAIQHLSDFGFEVYTVDIRPLPGELPETNHRIVDLFDPVAVRSAMEAIRPSHLLHFAWFVTPGAFWSSPENLRWVGASLDLLRAFVECGGQRSVVAGTCAEYDWSGDGTCREDETRLRPATLYGACKAGLSMMHEQHSRQSGTSGAWGRVFHLYGPHEPPSRLVPSIVQSLLRQEPANCTHGKQVRDFIHVDDVARAFVTLLDSGFEGAVNIASGVPVSIGEIATRLAQEVGQPDLLRLGALPAPASEPATLVASVDRLRGLGFTQRYSIEEGLRRTVAWWRG